MSKTQRSSIPTKTLNKLLEECTNLVTWCHDSAVAEPMADWPGFWIAVDAAEKAAKRASRLERRLP